jgi:chloramphenicol 3-O-phosphotransferase
MFFECVKDLENYPVIFVKVDCQMNELERREKERGDRPIGTAKWQYNKLFPQNEYDLIVDTHKDETDKCVFNIINFIEKVNYTSFHNILINKEKVK